MTSSLPTYSRVTIPPLEAFLKEIIHDHPVGDSLRYDPLYDEVRLARQEDDPRLSMGIWKTDLKRSDWTLIEKLCIDALINRSKDLQIAAWLTEAWTTLDNIKGYIRGIHLISTLSQTFWTNIHPQPSENGDMENRQLIFEWMDTAFSVKLMAIPLTQSKYDQSALGLGFYKSAQHYDAVQKRVDNKGKKTSQTVDTSKIVGTLEVFQKSLDQTVTDFLFEHHQNICEALEQMQIFKNDISSLVGSGSPSFSQIIGTLKDMKRILAVPLQKREPQPILPAKTSDSLLLSNSKVKNLSEQASALSVNDDVSLEASNLKTRDDAYHQLKILAFFLEKHDPHSLAPQLLHQLISWKDKTIVDIFNEIAQTPDEYNILMRILKSSPPPSN